MADRVEVDDAGVPVVDLSTGCEQARCCPQCGQRAARVKQWATTRPRDLPVGGRPVRLRWRKRRWYCPTPACPRKSFTEQVAQVPARSRLTTRLRQAAGAAVADGGRTIVQAARDHGVSWPVVARAFTAHATAVLPDEPQPVTVLGIDEVRRGKPRWSWDAQAGSWTTTADRWHVGFVDLSGGQGLLAQVSTKGCFHDRSGSPQDPQGLKIKLGRDTEWVFAAPPRASLSCGVINRTSRSERRYEPLSARPPGGGEHLGRGRRAFW
ncbi:transposase family protein [Micromonospora sp. B11E3]|uniref:transposase family protein n=1 Tax=Micromonospora sp. B11E3 TaxID=3153562 RepID=UPI00325FD148